MRGERCLGRVVMKSRVGGVWGRKRRRMEMMRRRGKRGNSGMVV